MNTLTYLGRVPESALVGRLLGPDAWGAYVVVTKVDYVERGDQAVTLADCRPVGPTELSNRHSDECGQLWLDKIGCGDRG